MTDEEMEEENARLKMEFNRLELQMDSVMRDYAELQKLYDELNEFDNSQSIKLLKQIEKMKCCKNCKHNDCMHYEVCDNCNNHDKWELAE